MSEILLPILDNYASISIFLLALILAAFLWRARMDLKEFLSKLDLERFMLIAVFILIIVFLIYPWLPNETDPYLILGLFAISASIPLLSRFDVIKHHGTELRRSEPKVESANQQEVKEGKEKEEGELKSQTDDQKSEDIRRRIIERREKREKIENKVLDSFSSKNEFQKHAKLQLDEDADPIADVGRIIFDGFYRDWRRRYFIKIVFSSSMYTVLSERLYRDIRVMKDLTDGTPYRKYILKIAYIKSDGEADRELVALNRLKNYFGKAIRDEYLEIKVFNENGEEINA